MNETAHLTWARIVAMLVDHRDTDGSAGRHVDGCSDCRARLERAGRMLAALPDAFDAGAPDTWVARAAKRALPRAYFAPLHGPYTAQIVFDSARDLRAGIRAASEGGRQWLLATERIEIELHLGDPLEDAPFQLSGQLFAVEGEAPDLDRCRVVLEVGGRAVDETRTGSGGTFFLHERPADAFLIRVEGDGWELSTPLLKP
jgi:hypothetical protein